jgi:hypothetical protein
MPERLTIGETDDWYEVVDEQDLVVAQFTDHADARWFVDFKAELDDDTDPAEED